MQVGKAVAVDVAGTGYAPARIVILRIALDDKAVPFGGQLSQINHPAHNRGHAVRKGDVDVIAKAGGLFAKHDVGLAGIAATVFAGKYAPTMRSA